MNGPMKCRDTTFLVSEARDRALTASELKALNAHIVECALCQQASKQFADLFLHLDELLGRNSEPLK